MSTNSVSACFLPGLFSTCISSSMLVGDGDPRDCSLTAENLLITLDFDVTSMDLDWINRS